MLSDSLGRTYWADLLGPNGMLGGVARHVAHWGPMGQHGPICASWAHMGFMGSISQYGPILWATWAYHMGIPHWPIGLMGS